ncbi:MAG: caspase family protein [Alphaproteobacteria bacterium]|uniref:Caspase family protein n=1 Tax=Candidatus Nitrobium versatile TaxID=2884831 RepID=A0A953JAP9_9BACT|nr:caspase family protein [Candidatus Nitrobium versatile]
MKRFKAAHSSFVHRSSNEGMPAAPFRSVRRAFLLLALLIHSLFLSPSGVLAQHPAINAAAPETVGKEINAIAGLSDGKVSSGSRLFILAVGINEYKNPKMRLRFGRSDAEAFVQTVEQHGKKIFHQIEKLTIYDSHAVRSTIEDAFGRISSEVRPEDVFVFYYAGHGVMSRGDAAKKAEFYMALSDVTRLSGDHGMLEEKGLSARLLRELSSKVKARKQLLVLDACHSGGALDNFSLGASTEGKAVHQMTKGLDITVLAAAGASQSATEFRQLGHGVFTFALMKGLAGEADSGLSSDGTITVKELVAYLNTKVPEITRQYKGAAQNPNSFARGEDFPLSAR